MRRSKREIESSEQHYKSVVDNAGPYIEIAQSLQQRVSERLSRAEPQEVVAVMTQSIAGQEDELVRKGIEAKIQELPVPQLLGMYAQILGDDSVNEPLKRLAAVRHRQLEREARIAELRECAWATRAIDLDLMREGEIIDIDLFSSTSHAGSSYMSNARRFSARKHSADNVFEVVRDDPYSPGYQSYVSMTTVLSPGTVGKFGTALKGPEGMTVEPRIGLFSQIAIEVDVPGRGSLEGICVPPHAYVGRVAVNTQLLLDASQPR